MFWRSISLASGDISTRVMRSSVDRIARETLRRGLIPGIFTPGAELARAAMNLGYRFVTAGSDSALLGGAARAVLGELRRQESTPAPPTGY